MRAHFLNIVRACAPILSHNDFALPRHKAEQDQNQGGEQRAEPSEVKELILHVAFDLPVVEAAEEQHVMREEVVTPALSWLIIHPDKRGPAEVRWMQRARYHGMEYWMISVGL
jgi:hypothetical protein